MMSALSFPLLRRAALNPTLHPSLSRLPSLFPALPSLPIHCLPRLFSTRPPDTFDPIDDRDDHLTPPSTRGLSQAEFDALPPTEQAAIRQAELDLIAAEDTVTPLTPPDDGDVEEGDFNPPPSSLTSLPPRVKPSLFYPDFPPGTDLPPSAYRSAAPSWVHFQTGNPEFIPPSPLARASTPPTPSPPATPPSPSSPPPPNYATPPSSIALSNTTASEPPNTSSPSSANAANSPTNASTATRRPSSAIWRGGCLWRGWTCRG